jgi:hypothetical protein
MKPSVDELRPSRFWASGAGDAGYWRRFRRIHVGFWERNGAQQIAREYSGLEDTLCFAG